MKMIISLMIMALSLNALAQSDKPTTKEDLTANYNATLKNNKAVAQRYFTDVINLKKIDLIKNDFTDDMVMSDGKEISNIKRQEDWVKYVFVGLPDIQYTIKDIVAEGNMVVVKADLKATHKGEFLGYKPLNNKIDITEVFFFTFENGKIKSYTGHSDMYRLSFQMTAKP